MHRNLSGILAGAFLLAAQTANGGDTIVTIPVAGPVTGSQALYGAYMLGGAKAAAEVETAKGGIAFKIEPEDDTCTPKDAVSVANRIVAHDAKALFGHFCSGATLAAMDTYAEHGILQLTISQADAITAKGKRHSGLFRINASNAQLGDALAREVLSGRAPHEKVAILYDQGIYGQSIRDVLLPLLAAKGVTPYLADFTEGDHDFSAIVTRLRADNIARVVIAGNADKIGLAIRQARDGGFKGRFFTPGTGTLPDVGAMAFCAIDGTVAVGVGVDRSRLEASPAVKEALKRQDAPPQDTALIAYAAIEVLAEAFRRAGNNQEKLIETVRYGSFNTLIGPVSWDANGNLQNAPIRTYRWSCNQGQAVLSPVP